MIEVVTSARLIFHQILIRFAIVETACNEGIPDIIGEISPLVFYCSSCGAVSDLRNPDAVDKYTWKCKNPDCGKWAVKQLQMIYACECGYAQPIKIPHVAGGKEFQVPAPMKPANNKNCFHKERQTSEKSMQEGLFKHLDPELPPVLDPIYGRG